MKLNSTFFIFLFSSAIAHAQAYRGDKEIAVGFGSISGLDIIYSVGYNPDAGDLSRTLHYVYAASYKYYLSDRCALGIGIAQHSFAEHYFNVYNQKKVDNYYDGITANAEVKISYINHQYFQFYGTYALGVFYAKGNNSAVYPSLYASPLGIRIGNKVAFFTESGIGYKGLIHCGISTRLGS